jgi:parallel beta-helix repeat protein
VRPVLPVTAHVSKPAIFIISLESQGTSDRNTVSNNKLNDGILVNGNATGTLLERNTANGNGDNGIHVDAAGTTVTRNTANVTTWASRRCRA